MPSNERDGSRDRDLVVRHHQHSMSEIGRSIIPMWDSSDPVRAPPPLPMNPSSSSPKTRANASPGIQAAAASLTEKMRDNTPSAYTTNPMPLKSSPERSLIKGQYHKRMQSFENNADTHAEFCSYLETRTPARPSRASILDFGDIGRDKSPTRPGTLAARDSAREMPPFQISSRFLSKPILGESTPPSATVLALQNMQVPDEVEPEQQPQQSTPINLIETGCSPNQSLESLSAQILSLTSIATNLQREMVQLSRRSKDNATDLLSLKAATNARDEDIRKSIRELASNISSKLLDPEVGARSAPYAHIGPGYMIDNRSFDSSPSSRKSYALPRVSSPGSLAAALERDLCGSPAPISDGSASIALLEKVLREMATKEAQEKLLELVNEMKKRSAKDEADKDADKTVTKMLEEIHNLVKSGPPNSALVRSNGGGAGSDKPQVNIDFADAPSGALTRVRQSDDLQNECDIASDSHSRAIQKCVAAPPFVTEDMLDTLNRVKNSVAEGGGLTSEVKALVRELRGEVLGMGREIARKLEEALVARITDEDKQIAPGKEEISEIMEDGLVGLKEQLSRMIQEYRKEISSSISRAVADQTEMFEALKAAIAELPVPPSPLESTQDRIEKEDVLEAVREAWENYKPEIELQNFGLERDEILDCLSEGLKAYQPQHKPDAIYDQVLTAVQTGLQNFMPAATEPQATRDEILECLAEGLKAYRPQHELGVSYDQVVAAVEAAVQGSMPPPSQLQVGRDEILVCVNEGLKTYQPQHDSTMIYEQVFTAVQAGIKNFMPSPNESRLERDEVLNCLSEGLKAYQAQHDPEIIHDQVLAAVQAGIQGFTPNLNGHHEGITKDDMVAAVQECLENFEFPALKSLQLRDPGITNEEVQDVISNVMMGQNGLAKELFNSSLIREDVLRAVTEGLAAHHSAAKETEGSANNSNQLVLITKEGPNDEEPAMDNVRPGLTREEVLGAISEGLARHEVVSKEVEVNKDELYAAITSGFNEVRGSTNFGVGEQVLERLQDLMKSIKDEFKESFADSSKDTEQVLDAIKDGLEALRSESESYVGRIQDLSGKREIIDTVKEGFRLLQADLERTINDAASQSLAGRNNPDTPELLDAMDKEFEHLRQTLSSLLIRNNISSDKEEIIDAIRDLSEHYRTGNDTSDLAKLVKDEFEGLHQTISMSMVLPQASDKDEILAALKERFQALQAEITQGHEREGQLPNTSELLNAFNESVGTIRDDLETLMNKPSDGSSTDIPETLREGLSSIKADLEALRGSQKEFEESSTVLGKELILASENAIGSDIESLKILITKLQVKVDTWEFRLESPADSLRRGDLEEILAAVKDLQHSIAEVRSREIPVDPASFKRANLDEVPSLVKELQDAVLEISSREAPVDPTIARKDDIDGIQSLLRDVNAKINAVVLPLPDDGPKSEQLLAIEALVTETKDKITELSLRMTDGPSKAEIGTLETLLKDVWVAVDDLKNKESLGEGDAERLAKSDLQTIEAMIFEVKTQIEDLRLPDMEGLPTKTEIEVLSSQVAEFKEMFEGEAGLTAQALEARKIEHAGLAEKVEEAKLVVSELGDELRKRLDGSDEGFSELQTLLQGLTTLAEGFSTVTSIQDLTNLINREFERSREERQATKLETEERDAAVVVKQDEARTAIIVDLSDKIDQKVGEVIAKYDKAQGVMDAKLSEIGEQEFATLEAMTSTKSISEDIKLIIGAMGNSMTETLDRMSDETKMFLQKVVEESYNKMEELHNEQYIELEKTSATAGRVEQQILEYHPQILNYIKDILMIVSQHYEHSQTSSKEIRMDLMAVPATITPLLPALPPPEPKELSIPEKYDDTEVQTKLDVLLDFAENPRKDEAQVYTKLDTLLNLAENPKKDDIEVQSKLDALLNLAENPKEVAEVQNRLDALLNFAENPKEDARIQNKLDALINLAENPKDDTEVHNKLDLLLSLAEDCGDSEVHNKLDFLLSLIEAPKHDDTELNNKLDTLLGLAENADKTMSQIAKLDDIHEKVIATSREITEMVATHSKFLTEDHERKKQEAEEAAIALERRLAQKDKVEADVVSLTDEKDALLQVIQVLKQEKEELAKQNTKLTKELSGLETALEIRQEEMRLMEERAETLERRILEGVLDHARTVLLSRPGGSTQGMSLKRVPSYASTATKTSRTSAVSTTKDSRTLVGSSVGIALKRRNPAKPNNPGSAALSNTGKERRILSLSHVTGNRGSADRQAILSSSNSAGSANLKRSHSVKSNFPSRKTSWGIKNSLSNKENESFQEDEEPDAGSESDTGTERRTSYAGAYTDSMLYETGSALSTGPKQSRSSSVNVLIAVQSDSQLGDHDQDFSEDQGVNNEGEEPVPDGVRENWDGVPEDRYAEIESPKMAYSNLHCPSDSGIGSEIPGEVDGS